MRHLIRNIGSIAGVTGTTVMPAAAMFFFVMKAMGHDFQKAREYTQHGESIKYGYIGGINSFYVQKRITGDSQEEHNQTMEPST